MTTVAHGPYEHTGAYADLAESETFDTSGTPAGFCPDCEHAPCVAGPAPSYCARRPRFFVRRRFRQEVLELVYDVDLHYDVLGEALVLAIYALGDASWRDGWDGDQAWKELLSIHSRLRSDKEAQS